ncbi:hypothetical protein DICSQDRAFT_171499 [Dichomitus squalens LYAD-421 SS1]|uniref:Uncharacterized protein n=1 Tax=Dichomitus squalens (strain LYAD-421) TaxID=732165 RepID=R7SYE5_DICSQ|nr:uncharacterized protein DICSQDRAFT_171499 [Dichomitus squalens LYAD-421 SS1]EJF60012.1 hypothetical protein DICSQDRAFT_171499 [Dichomitus squalens LYAD-421 SS1]
MLYTHLVILLLFCLLEPEDPLTHPPFFGMPTRQFPEDVIQSLSRLIFACVLPGHTTLQLCDPESGDICDYQLVKYSPAQVSEEILPSSALNKISLSLAMLDDLVDGLQSAIRNNCDTADFDSVRPIGRTQTPAKTISTVAHLSDSLFTSDDLDTSRPLSELCRTMFYSDPSKGQCAISPLPPISPTPHRYSSTLWLNDESTPSDADPSTTSITGTIATIDEERDEVEDSWSTYESADAFLDCSPVSAMLEISSSALCGLAHLPSDSDIFAPDHGTSSSGNDRQSNFSARGSTGSASSSDSSFGSLRVNAFVSSFKHPSDFRIIHSPNPAATSTPMRTAMRRALAVMVMHRDSPQARPPAAQPRERSRDASSPLSRSELISLPPQKAAERIMATVKAREEERTRAWAAMEERSRQF